MQPILSPAEALGLLGAALESRVRNAGLHVADATLAAVAKRLSADALANGIFYEHEGLREPVRIMLRPLLAQRDQLTYVHYVCLRISEALSRLPTLFLDDAKIRKLVPLNAEEERWLREIWTPSHGRNNAVYGRLDAACDFTSANWRDTLQFMEPNLSGVGGIHYAPIAEQLVMRDVVPALLAYDPRLVIELPKDQRDLFVQLLIDHARDMGRASCRFCFVEPKYEHDGPDEQAALRRYLSDRHGLTITHADPGELEARNGEVYHDGIAIDIVYRDYEMRDLIALERKVGSRLEGMRQLFRENRVISSLVGDFDHKSGFEILTDQNLAEQFFSPEDCRLFRRHVLWTRLLSDRRTSLPDGSSGDLLGYVRHHREQLVLKPNRGCGGTGVTIGALTETRQWEELIDRALTSLPNADERWVVQAATTLPVVEFPVVGQAERIHYEPFYAVMGFAPTDNGVGAMCRVSQKQVVNVAQHGGLAAVLIGEPPKSLRIPKRPITAIHSVKETLRREIAELCRLHQSISLLEWDEEVMLPVHGRFLRGEQIATLEGLRHSILASDRLADLIEEVAVQVDGDSDLEWELHLLRRERRRAITVPEDLVRNLANAKSQALAAWEEARVTGEFGTFAVPFSQLLALVRERAQCLASDEEPYDTLLNEHEPGMTRSRLDPIFNEMRARLVPFVQEASTTSASDKIPPSTARFSAQAQWELSRRILRAIGFDFDRGRLDPTTHPFTMLAGEDDVRIASRVDESDPTSAILTTLHEGGHALYDQGFNLKYRGSLLADGASSGMHEGQARLWENHVGRCRAFFEFLTPQLLELFPHMGGNAEVGRLWRRMNAVRPGVNRVCADEITYHLHIIVRYKLEIALLAAELPVSELPDRWNSLSQELIGVCPRNHREGILQDVHWAVGMFGYFPTYTIGSLYAAQLMKTYSQSHDLKSEIRAGQFTPLREWLAKNVYETANRQPAEQIMTSVTGCGLDTSAFFEHLASADRAWSDH
jgi:carboxypeptidase Taq